MIPSRSDDESIIIFGAAGALQHRSFGPRPNRVCGKSEIFRYSTSGITEAGNTV